MPRTVRKLPPPAYRRHGGTASLTMKLAANLQRHWVMAFTSYMYTYRVRPEQRAEFVTWARGAGIPFWLSRPGLLSYRTYRVHAGNGVGIGLAEFESGEALGRMLDSPEWAKIADEFYSYVTETQSWVLGPGATGAEPLKPAASAVDGARPT